ncbi:alpha/beta fold hydrolase [Nocardioides sp. 1609]|uniref:esterase/lipase family protein n=1 Tax=Nocardioides sp. 1609 TaxID=2508327 RepID=UPI00106FB94B|nr:alpha/beta fold hydrolase [Nocardioides sp. 1609]
MPPSSGPRLLDALSLLGVVADELVLRSVRDTHLAWADRAHGLTDGLAGGAGSVPGTLHRGTAGAVYGGLGLGLRAVASGLDRAAAAGLGPGLEETRPGRFLAAAVNGLIGDRLLEERPQLAIAMAVRRDEVDVDPERSALAAAFPDAGGRLVLFVHGLCEDETHWSRHRDRTGTTYGEALAADGWTPVFLRLNTGLPLRENGVALAALAQRLVEQWPVPVERIVLVGHSMGGLVVRAAGAVAAGGASDGAASDGSGPASGDWNALVTDVVTLGTPHLGAPVARGVGHGSRGLSRLPETAAFGRILDWRSAGVHDLVAGLTDDVAPLPHARYHLVCATLTSSERHPVGHVVGDLLVRPESAYGRDRWGGELFPGADVLHVGGTDHWGLLNHPDVLASLRTWLA